MVRGSALLISYVVFLICATPVAGQYADVLTIVTPPHGITPKTPTRMTVESPSLALDTALIQWKIDGIEVTRGIGKRDADITLVDTRSHEVAVTVTEQHGVTRTEKVTLSASDIDLIWEAETLVPPLYGGRALPTAEAVIRAETLLTTHKDSSPTTHIYTWKVDGRTLYTDSGIGKNTLRYLLPTFEKSVLLQVTVQEIDGDFTGQNSVRIATVDPRIVLYERKPLLGLWTNTALFSSTLTSAGVRVVAYPLFISAASLRDGSLQFEWTGIPKDDTIDAEEASPAEKLVTSPEDFSVHVTQKRKLLQEARASGSVSTHNTTASQPIFGITE